MSLISLQFVLFIAAVYAAYFLVGHVAPQRQWWVLLVANLAFYALAGRWQAFGFVLVVAGATWQAARVMGGIDERSKAARKATRDRKERKALKAAATKRKRVVLVATLVICLGILGYLKYWNVLLFNVGLAQSTNSLGILLPLGISFYTFQSIMYLVDVYNEKYAPEGNFARYLTFVSYFPQMVQGPINRYPELAPQLLAPHDFDPRQTRRGLWLLWYGAFKKLVIANVLAGNVGTIFSHVNVAIPGSAVVLGIVSYSIQMYADFSGGIDIVRGASEMLGIEMALNFRQPYLSQSLSEFWQRWHMSLGALMKDYVFYPLALTKPLQRLGRWGQKRLGRHVGRTLPACVANIVVFAIVGLWHGAEWHYLIWGALNGVIIAASDLLQPVFGRAKEALHVREESLPYRLFGMARTFTVVCFVRYFDVLDDPAASLICLRNTFCNFLPTSFSRGLERLGVAGAASFGLSRLAIAGCLVVLVVSIFEERGVDVRERLMGIAGIRGALVRTGVIAGMLVLVLLSLRYSMGGAGEFAYANF